MAHAVRNDTGTTRPSAASGPGEDWPAQAADTIERVVGAVRSKTTGPAITVARGLVYGLLAAIVAMAAFVMAAIAAVRALDVYLPESVFGEENTWAAHLVIGLVFCLGGMWCWSRRRRPSED